MLVAGRQLGRYQIRSVLGVGGMGEVYLAYDDSLGRSVAIKTLPADLEADHDRVARFEREARLLASLSHANIAAVHGFEHADGVRYLVLEHVDGPTLQEKLTSGPLPLSETLALARQIALALEAAHAAGVIHRDLKPANIKIKADDTVKVLDFGLAKAIDSSGGPARADGNGEELSNSPTVTSGVTRDGVLLGTAAYMSPEQARGKAIDQRSDLWAFGCVVYEMLVGHQAFGGATIADSLANVLNRPMDWDRLLVATPAPLRRLLRRCLERDPKTRLNDANDARLEIDDAIACREDATSTSDSPRHKRWRWAVAGAIGSAAIGATLWSALLSPQMSQAGARSGPIRFEIPVSPPMLLSLQNPTFAASPDGQLLVLAVVDSQARIFRRQLQLRRLGSLAVEPIKGTEDGTRPFFLPDGETVGFVTFTSAEIKLVNLRTGEIRVVCKLDSSDVFGAPTVAGSLLVFSHLSPGSTPALKTVPLTGGTPSQVFSIDLAKDDIALYWPQAMPDGDHLLVTVAHATRQGSLELISLKTGTRAPLLEGALFGRYVQPGFLVFMRSGTAGTGGISGDLVAVRFSSRSFTMSGEPVVLVPSLLAVRGVDIALSGDTLLTRQAPPSAYLGASSLAWIDRAGLVAPLEAAHRPYRQPHLSPSGDLLAYQLDDRSNRDIWVYDIRRNVTSRVTSNPEEDETPRWMPDGRRLVFISLHNSKRHLVMAPADGSGPEELLAEFDDHVHINGVRADGSEVFLNVRNSSTKEDVWIYSFASRTAKPFVVTPSEEFGAEPSPDGHLVAFVSDESGRAEVFVRDRQSGGRTQVSRDGGVEPAWSRDGRQLFFRNLDGSQLLRVDVAATNRLNFGPPTEFLKTAFPLGGRDSNYVVHADGNRLLILQGQVGEDKINVLLNWTAGLRQ